jgi:hypothetical protein
VKDKFNRQKSLLGRACNSASMMKREKGEEKREKKKGRGVEGET